VSRLAVIALLLLTITCVLVARLLDRWAVGWGADNPWTAAQIGGLLGVAPAALAALVVIERVTTIEQRSRAARTLAERREHIQATAWHEQRCGIAHVFDPVARVGAFAA
jgi:hypothetical protein